MSQKNYKFNLEKKLNELSYDERSIALKLIPDQLGISKDSFYIWRRIEINSKQDIPSLKLIALAHFFHCSVNELINCDVPAISMKTINTSRKRIKEKHGLVAS